MVSNKEEILQAILEEDGVFASSHYLQIDYEYKENPMANSNANKIHKKIINLFNDFKFTREQAYLVVDVVSKYIR